VRTRPALHEAENFGLEATLASRTYIEPLSDLVYPQSPVVDGFARSVRCDLLTVFSPGLRPCTDCYTQFRLTTYRGRSFICATAVWNSLPDSVKDTALSVSCFQNHLKAFLFSCY